MNDTNNNVITDRSVIAANVPYIAFESLNARLAKAMRVQAITAIAAIIALVISNGIWLYAWMQYDYSSSTEENVELTSDSAPANYIKGDGGVINNAESQSSSKENEDQKKGGQSESEKEEVDHE